MPSGIAGHAPGEIRKKHAGRPCRRLLPGSATDNNLRRGRCLARYALATRGLQAPRDTCAHAGDTGPPAREPALGRLDLDRLAQPLWRTGNDDQKATRPIRPALNELTNWPHGIYDR
jgi:hypothetical protein